MEGMILIAFATAVSGGVAGWFSRGKFYLTIPICTVVSILSITLAMISDRDVTWQNWIGELLWLALPFTLFILVPCFAGGLLMTVASLLVQRHKKQEKI